VVTDAYGAVLNKTSFDPFGGRREATWNKDITIASMNQLLTDEDLRESRGFTDHEALNRTGFVHMNGRVFDPRIGRFVSPDPIVQAPGHSQSYNRYAYVFNSPLSYTDPSGLECFGGGDWRPQFCVPEVHFPPPVVWVGFGLPDWYAGTDYGIPSNSRAPLPWFLLAISSSAERNQFAAAEGAESRSIPTIERDGALDIQTHQIRMTAQLALPKALRALRAYVSKAGSSPVVIGSSSGREWEPGDLYDLRYRITKEWHAGDGLHETKHTVGNYLGGTVTLYGPAIAITGTGLRDITAILIHEFRHSTQPLGVPTQVREDDALAFEANVMGYYDP
jgi:RHS repeat-associated protein